MLQISECYQWPKAHVFRATGKDSERYLHNRLTQNIKALKNWDWKPFAATNPASKVQAMGNIIKVAAEEFLIIALGGDAESIHKALTQYIVADRVSINLVEQAAVFYLNNFAEPLELSNCQSVSISNPEIKVFADCDDRPLVILLQTSYGVELIDLNGNSGISGLATEDWMDKERVTRKLLLPDIDYDHTTLLLDTGNQEAIAFGAGCYVGQEVIEKTDALGRTPNKFIFFTTQQPTKNPRGEPVYIYQDKSWNKKGLITSSAFYFDSLSNITTCYNIAKIKNEAFEGIRVAEYEGTLI